MPSHEPGVGNPVSPAGSYLWKRQDLPSSWATPMSVCSCSTTPASQLVPDRMTPCGVGFQNNRLAPATGTTEALARNNLSKLNHTASGLAAYASSHSLPHATQDSLPAVGQTLPDGLSTRRVTIEGFRFTSCQSSSFAKLLGAIPFVVETDCSLSSIG